MKLLMTGATGLVGKALGSLLAREGHQVIALSRRADQSRVPFAEKVYAWQPEKELAPMAAFEGVDTVFHLAGESVAARRWDDEQKRRIRDSRVIGTRNLVKVIESLTAKPSALISASAVGYYGNREDEVLAESSRPGHGFLAEVCVEWEREAQRAAEMGLRVAQLRIGVVLSPTGGALEQMLPVFKLGVGGKLGSGEQWFPWIHLNDVVGLFRHAMAHQQVSGPMNVVAPGIVTNAQFTEQIANALHRPAFLTAPEFGLRLILGEMAAVVLASQRVIPHVAQETGYKFHFATLPAALEELFDKHKAAATP